MSHKKFGPDRFSRFDVYWMQTNRQTNRQTDKPNLYVDFAMGKGANDSCLVEFKINLTNLFLGKNITEG